MKLSDEIVKSFLRTNNSLKENEKALKTIKFFASQNVLTVFGKDAYGADTDIDVEKEIIGDAINLAISSFDKKYIVTFQTSTITMRSSNSQESYTIYMPDEKKVTNTKIISEEDATKVEVQSVGMEENKETYDLVKQIHNNEDTHYVKTGYRLKPIGVKNNEEEFFELTSMYDDVPKSFLQRIVSLAKKEHIKTIRTTYEMTDLLDYLEEIYSILEEKCMEKVSVRKK